MRRAHSVADIRVAEAALMATLPDGALMDRAAHGLASVCAELLDGTYGARVVLLVGSGDNGGDALIAGALLAKRGARVDALLLAVNAHEQGLARFALAGGRAIEVSDADDPRVLDVLFAADLVIDGIVGIGGKGELREPAASIVDYIPLDAVIVAVDIPSGLDADTGAVEGAAVTADVTVCMGTCKPGLLIAPGQTQAGEVVVIDIDLDGSLGAPRAESLEADDVDWMLPEPGPHDDKYSRGVVGIVAGSDEYPGAAVMSVAGALHGGAGYVRFVGPESAAALVRQRFPEAVVTVIGEDDGLGDVGRVQAWVVGPGIGVDERAQRLVKLVLDRDEPTVIDAAALTVLADLALDLTRRTAPTLLTPHAGELANLTDVDRPEVERNALQHAEAAATTFGSTVLLKGITTIVADPHQAAVTRVNPTGTPWLGTAGSGDVLSGLCGALLANGQSAHDAGSVAAWLHGLAGTIAADDDQAPTTAMEVALALPTAASSVRRAVRTLPNVDG